jgi:DNA-binding beta-propeller fold protein YncE
VFNPDGTLDHVIDGPTWCSPMGITAAADKMIYIADTCTSSVLKITTGGELQGRFTAGETPGVRFEQPIDVVVDQAGMIYALDLRQRIALLDPTGALQTTWPVQIGINLGASNLAMLNGVLYLTNPDNHTVTAVDSVSGQAITFGRGGSGPGEFSQPVGIAAGPDGRIYVMDSDSARIEVFPPPKLGQ